MLAHPPLLLVPGMMCDARLFAPQIAAFSARRGVQVATTAHGETVEALAAAILADAPPLFALAGLSMGGIVAMEIVRRAPGRVAGLALLDTNPMAETPETAARREPQIERVRAGNLAGVVREELAPLYVEPDAPAAQAIRELCVAMAQALGPATFERQSRALQRRPDQRETLRGVRVPTLVLCGAQDRLCPLDRHTLMAELVPDAELVVLQGTGHLPTIEAPEATNAALDGWLARVDVAASRPSRRAFQALANGFRSEGARGLPQEA
ncbi:alpha/beta fold hydrolase [Salinarimonas ramus]|uniref:Alpha/beta hydrolase n=1 Tax=Salinarimonas ramus TaxID=690164 RepID=A0A917V525_9HYPH|nr:alpha/beta fold hydrolase [Salinarimonas ramus]GGK37717.1 alpha/beta hydrolase [Salinarimonas ramus]